MSIRKDINDVLKKQYPIYPINTQKGEAKKTYLVLKFSEESKSNQNSFGSFIYFEVLVYVPSNSIAPMEDEVNKVKLLLSDVAEFTGRVTEDYFDDNVKAYMRSIEFKISIAN